MQNGVRRTGKTMFQLLTYKKTRTTQNSHQGLIFSWYHWKAHYKHCGT